MTISELEKELKNNKINSLYVFYGEEKYLLDMCLKKIKKIFGETVKGINYIQIDESNIYNLISDIETPAFGYDRKLIIIKNTGILKSEGRKKNAKMVQYREELLNYFKENIDDIKIANNIVFIEDEIDSKEKLVQYLIKNGEECNFEKQRLQTIVARLKSICNAYKVNVRDDDLKYLIESCGTSMQDLINEVRKLIEFAGKNGSINREDIDALCTKQIEAVIFDLTDSLGKKDINSSLLYLKNLLYNKEPIQKIFITLYNHFKKIYFTKLALIQNKDIATALNLKPNQIFLTKKYKAQSGYFTKKELENILKEFIELDENIKSGLIDINIGLESILSKYCS